MKLISRLIIFVFAFLALATFVQATTSSREQLNVLVTQLRQTPGDHALREDIIKLALTMKPEPAVPEEAERRLGRGQVAFEIAKEPADFEKAIAEFQAASNAAPWLAAPYYNLGVAQEKAKKYREAMTSFKLYLLAAPSAADAGNVKQTIFKLEFLAEQPPSDEELLTRLNGARFVITGVFIYNDSRGDHIFEVRGRSIFSEYIFRKVSAFDRENNNRFAGQVVSYEMRDYTYKGGLKWESTREASCSDKHLSPSCFQNSISISQDGKVLTFRTFNWNDEQRPITISYPRN